MPMSIAKALQDLDYLLTGRAKRLETYPSTAETAMHEIIYLSDGGYSRLYPYFDESDTFGYRIGSESREAIKAKAKTQQGIAAMEVACTTINKAIQEMEQ